MRRQIIIIIIIIIIAQGHIIDTRTDIHTHTLSLSLFFFYDGKNSVSSSDGSCLDAALLGFEEF